MSRSKDELVTERVRKMMDKPSSIHEFIQTREVLDHSWDAESILKMIEEEKRNGKKKKKRKKPWSSGEE